jgi:hypothetical protein
VFREAAVLEMEVLMAGSRWKESRDRPAQDRKFACGIVHAQKPSSVSAARPANLE